MSVVLNSSGILVWVHGDDRTFAIEPGFDLTADCRAVAPRLWRLGVANSLHVSVWRERISPAERDNELADLAQLVDLPGVSVCDAAYLELAQCKRLPIITLDKALIRAAQTACVEVLP